jgi:hypothetical protein
VGNAIREIPVSIHVSPKRVAIAITAIALLNLCMLGGAWLFIIYYRSVSNDWSAGSAVKYLLVQFNLATENVVATWYASMLLLLVSGMAILCFLADRTRHHSGHRDHWSLGWLLVSLVFAGLSLDELGSVHERVGMVAALNPFGDYAPGWVDLLALPIGLVALFLLVFGWVRVRRSQWAFALMIVGITLFLSIPIQERIEMSLWHSAPAREQWQRPILHLVLEEGAELFGSLCFFSATAVYLLSGVQQSASATKSLQPNLHFTLERKTILAGVVVIIGLLALGMIGVEFLMEYIPEGDKGIPQNWFPSALAGLAAILCLQIWNTARRYGRINGIVYLAAALFSMLLSLYYGANIQGWLSTAGKSAFSVRHFLKGSLSVVAVLLGIALALKVQPWWSRVGTVAWGLLSSLAMSMGRSYAGWLDLVAFAILLPSLVMHLYGWQPLSNTLLYKVVHKLPGDPIKTSTCEHTFPTR